MPAEGKPLFRPDILRSHLAAFVLPARAEAHRDKVRQVAALLAGPQAGSLKESELLPHPRAEKGVLYDIGGIEDHVHLYCGGGPTRPCRT